MPWKGEVAMEKRRIEGAVFAPIPARALIDPRLKGRHLHLQILGLIAVHDRFGANGVGCYAGHNRLAGLAGCDYTRLSATVRDLGEWGYLVASPHPLNKRLRVYRVIYDDGDGELFSAETRARMVGAPANEEPQTVGLDISQPIEEKEESSINIFCETENIPAQAKGKGRGRGKDTPPYVVASSGEKYDARALHREACICESLLKRHPEQSERLLDRLVELYELAEQLPEEEADEPCAHIDRIIVQYADFDDDNDDDTDQQMLDPSKRMWWPSSE
jgi:hypothetical protein